MIVVDSSAVVAILFGEPTAPASMARLAADPDRIMSAANDVEAGAVLAGRRRAARHRAIADLDGFLDRAGLKLVPIEPAHARLAPEARITHGRGMGHGGSLNFGDAFAYALAKAHAAPLLYVGQDFGTTDITAALDPGTG